MKQKQQSQIVPPDQPIPAGTKQVTRSTVERFSEPLPENDADHLEDFAEELDPIETELPDAEEEEIVLSPLDRFLQSLSEADDAVIYVRRKTDPPGLQRPFKNPWSSPIVTVGEIPYDESFTDKTAIDLAVQKIFGGGYFQLQIRRSSGQILKTWSTLIADVIERRAEEQSTTAPPERAPSSDGLGEIEKSMDVIERVWNMMNSRRRAPNNEAAAGSALATTTPPDPAEELTRTVDMFDKMTQAMDRLRPAGSGSGDKGLGATAINAVGSLLRDPNVGPGIGALLSAVAAKLASPPNGAAPPPSPNSKAPAPGEQAPQTQQRELSLAEIAYWRVIRRCAADMSYSTNHVDEAGAADDVCDEDVAVDATLALVTDFPEYRPQIDRVLSAPPNALVMFVATQCQDVTLMQNPGSVLFATAYQNTLRERFEETNAAAPDTARVVDFPSRDGAGQSDSPSQNKPVAETGGAA